jgi:alcohol/geraniol dehydrogenase (NADP+)
VSVDRWNHNRKKHQVDPKPGDGGSDWGIQRRTVTPSSAQRLRGASAASHFNQEPIVIHAYAAQQAQGTLSPISYDPGALKRDEVEINVVACGICHSDLSMLNNEWQMTQYPFVPGHEVIGTVGAVGEGVTHLRVGDAVGLGWFSRSCMTCPSCMGGDHNLCATNEGTIVARHGGFANKVRAQAAWTMKLPAGLDIKSAGPLFCGGITVFNPIVQLGIKPTDRVGVIGIGGLGHMAIKFLRAWGCEVTAFSSSPSKEAEAKEQGAHHFVSSTDVAGLAKIANSLDFILSTVNVPLDWQAYVNTLAPRGRLHVVGAVLEPIAVAAFPMIIGQKSLSGSPLGSPETTRKMLEFAARHKIAPTCEFFPMSKVNDALDRVRSNKARYRVVVVN